MTRIIDLISRFNLPVPNPAWALDAGPDITRFLSPTDGVAEEYNVRYGPHERNVLDVYRPAAPTGTLVFAHGGSWVFGTKDWYAPFARSMAAAGLTCVLPNYRLSPMSRHPAHAEDVAAAIRWAIETHGPRMAVGGHSAGAHLSSLVALDPRYGVSGSVSAVVGISGVYRLNRQFPGFSFVFGSDPGVESAASPLSHVKPGGPPVLAVYAANDYPTLDRQADELAAAVKSAGGAGEAVRVSGPDHVTIMADATAPGRATHEAIRRFVSGSGQPR